MIGGTGSSGMHFRDVWMRPPKRKPSVRPNYLAWRKRFDLSRFKRQNDNRGVATRCRFTGWNVDRIVQAFRIPAV